MVFLSVKITKGHFLLQNITTQTYFIIASNCHGQPWPPCNAGTDKTNKFMCNEFIK